MKFPWCTRIGFRSAERDQFLSFNTLLRKRQFWSHIKTLYMFSTKLIQQMMRKITFEKSSDWEIKIFFSFFNDFPSFLLSFFSAGFMIINWVFFWSTHKSAVWQCYFRFPFAKWVVAWYSIVKLIETLQ